MTKIEEEIKAVIPDFDTCELNGADEYNDLVAKAAAEVAKRYIEKAFEAGWTNGHFGGDEKLPRTTQEWLKENGITE